MSAKRRARLRLCQQSRDEASDADGCRARIQPRQPAPSRWFDRRSPRRLHFRIIEFIFENRKRAKIMSSHLRNHTLGWIGLGRMGYALAERLSRAGADLHGYNRTREKAEGLQAGGVTLVERPADLADRDIVFTMVSTADDLMAVTVGPEGLFSAERAPKVLIDMSTISTAASSEMRGIAKSHGCELLVVPVSGNDVVARAGKLSIIASGPRPVFDQVDRYLGCLGKGCHLCRRRRYLAYHQDLPQSLSRDLLLRIGRSRRAGRETRRAAARVLWTSSTSPSWGRRSRNTRRR